MSKNFKRQRNSWKFNHEIGEYTAKATPTGWAPRPWKKEDYETVEYLTDKMLAKRGCHPKHQSMRVRVSRDGAGVHINWYSDLGHGTEQFHHIQNVMHGLITKYIGKPFKDLLVAWHKTVTEGGLRYVRTQCRQKWVDFLEDLLDEFREGRLQSYYIDEDGNVRQVNRPSTKPCGNKDLKVYTGETTFTYKLREGRYWSIYNQLVGYFGRDVADRLRTQEVFTQKDFDHWVGKFTCFRWRDYFAENHPRSVDRIISGDIGGWWVGQYEAKRLCNWLFAQTMHSGWTIYRYGTKEYWARKQELHRQELKRRKMEQYRKTRYDLYLWYRNAHDRAGLTFEQALELGTKEKIERYHKFYLMFIRGQVSRYPDIKDFI